MTTLPPELTRSFKEAYKETVGQELTDHEADRIGYWLVNFLGTIAKIRAEQIGRKRDAA